MSLRALIRLAPPALALLLLALPAEASAAAYASRTLRVGAHGADVKRLQRYLGSAGHRVARDGEFGPRTLRALRATERELELRVDGVATRGEHRRRGVHAAASAGAGGPRRGREGQRRRLRGPSPVGAEGDQRGDRGRQR